MISVLDIERAASQLRSHLRRAQLPELRLLCGLRFFKKLGDHELERYESYFREFLPVLAESARKSHPEEFLPDEIESLKQVVKQVTVVGQSVSPGDLEALRQLLHDVENLPKDKREISDRKGTTTVNCLFVEYYPDLDLEPRGRLLKLLVNVSPISSKWESDDIVVRNPIEKPDDRFLAQARDSVSATRQLLHDRYRLSLDRRYRFDFAVDSTGARFTGDSLGLAFAVGAVVALSEIEILTEKLAVMPGTVFSGSLTSGGEVAAVDHEALKLKIYRAFHTDTRCFVVPSDQLSDAEAFAQQLEPGSMNKELTLIGVRTLEEVVRTRELIQAEPLSPATYITRVAARSLRATKVQVPLLLTLLAVLYAIICSQNPRAWIFFDSNPTYLSLTGKGFEALNRDSVWLWDVEYGCDLITSDSRWKIANLDDDRDNEVVFAPHATYATQCERNGNVYVYDSHGDELYVLSAFIYGQYPGDSVSGKTYPGPWVTICGEGDTGVILSSLCQCMPSRTHIRAWSSRGEFLWEYVAAGAIHLMPGRFSDESSVGFMFSGINNRTGSACFFVLSRDSCYGVSPPYDDPAIDLSWVEPGNQLHYIIFPKSDLCRSRGHLYNVVENFEFIDDTTIRVVTCEDETDVEGPQIRYFLNLANELRVTKVEFDDRFVVLREQSSLMGDLPPVDWPSYTAAIRESVAYWRDSGWVTEAELRSNDSQDLK